MIIQNAKTDSNEQLEDFIKEQDKIKYKRKIKFAIIIGVILITLGVVAVLIIIFTKKNKKKENEEESESEIYQEFKQNTFFFFDPVTNNPCNENNYWTPFFQSTTCYRFVSLTMNDTNETNMITIMLDHNIGVSNFSNYVNVLNNKTSNWSRHKGEYSIDIVDEETIFKVMKFQSKPNLTINYVKPGLRVYYYYGNSDYIINRKAFNDQGYWTKTKYNEENSYAINGDGYNTVISISRVIGIRPILTIKKSLLNIDSGIVNITDIIKSGEKIFIRLEDVKYDGYKFGGLQGLTVTDDKLIFMSAINEIPSKSVMYSYKLDDLDNIYKKDFSNTAHGNGMTYNSKKGKVLVIVNYDDYTIFEYNENTLIREKEHNRDSFPLTSGIGYDYNNDWYVGRSDPRLFLYDEEKNERVFQFSAFQFEASQDLEYYNGYIFDLCSDFGENSKYQNYSFYPGNEIIYIYDVKLDENKNPTKNFGRLIARLSMSGLGEIESISFRGGYVYIGFEVHYTFYKIEYDKFIREIKKIADFPLLNEN